IWDLCVTRCVLTLAPVCSRLHSVLRSSATAAEHTLALHGALPIVSSRVRTSRPVAAESASVSVPEALATITDDKASGTDTDALSDRKSTRLNSSHVSISYAVFCLNKKKQLTTSERRLMREAKGALH